jgi:FKBP-type peptidyl-prolyl cis-trans isomerase SlyD
MSITKGKVVTMHYTLKDESGAVIDSSVGHEPLAYLHGANNIVVGLEQALEGQVVGAKVAAIVAPVDGYGEKREDLQEQVPLTEFDDLKNVIVGAQFHMESPQGVTTATVTAVSDTTATLDLNHPLAGQTLYFDVEITDLRDATADEVTHGHAHGEGGHHH